jgi:hypothetical protein
MPQPPTFRIRNPDQDVTISPRDAERLVAALPEGSTAGKKIDGAMQLGSTTYVELEIGEDEAVLAALAELRASGDYISALGRLEKALSTKIEQEG